MLAILPVMAMAAAATTANPDAMKIELQDAHVLAAEAGGSTQVTALISNPTSSTLVLVGAATPVAGQTVLQKYVTTAQGFIQIAPLNRLRLPPRSETVLASGALELQLVGLTQPLDAGNELPLTLKFEDGTERVVRVRVEGE